MGTQATSRVSWPVVEGELEVVPAEDMSPDRFAAEYSQRGRARPVVVRAPRLYEAVGATWTDAYLERTIGELEVSVYVSADGTFPGGDGPYDPAKYRSVTMSFQDYLARTRGDGGAPLLIEGERYYLCQSPARLYERLLNDHVMPPFLPSDCTPNSNFWFSSAGNVTPAHYDSADNLLVQIRGVKEVFLWAPRDYPLLYLKPFGQVHSRQSPVVIDRPDLTAFPAFARARSWRARLGPGDILFLPMGWVHHVTTVEASISINHWWTPPELRTFITAVARLLQEPDDELLELAAHLLTERCGRLQR